MWKTIYEDTISDAYREVLTVSELCDLIKQSLEENISYVWVEGEVTSFGESGAGHWYFSLKDEKGAQIKAVCFAGVNSQFGFSIKNGMHVLVYGEVSFYKNYGDCQIVVYKLEPYGKGAIHEAIEQLKEKLNSEGLFDESRKKSLPEWVRRVGIVTSLQGAAITDMLKILREKTSFIKITLIPTKVQGNGAAEEIASAIRLANNYNSICPEEERIDVLIVGRGGGSIEDLMAYNSEVVARAIADSKIPIISAVGHERDFTIADLVADHRAPTPTAAAKEIAEIERKLLEKIGDTKKRLLHCIENIKASKENLLQRFRLPFSKFVKDTKQKRNILNFLTAKLRTSVENTLGEKKLLLDNLKRRVSPLVLRNNYQEKKGRFESLKRHLLLKRDFVQRFRALLELRKVSLNAVSPLAILERGYAIVRNQEGKIIKDANQVKKGEQLEIILANGRIICVVKE
ncbi:MAG: exodeoxyribonuclease VII large subunit [Pyrinomonadaceae bacterium]|nr:exodeoxyribonuclease VII large subunit [Pyrinomonadaceae bacterium]MCX7640184.1 exodeoxyribonuclease VII large subunit [Pyrinomonadaceae bacterium]MDW8303228.1 exodeoxyribonuclease VII large subunit [Acidobacteriota bacterium]